MMLNKKNKTDTILLIITFLFYLFFAIYDGVVLCDDSNKYINMGTNVEPLYPSLVALFRFLFSDFTSNYLLILVFFQSALLSYSTIKFVLYIKKEFELNNFVETIVLIIMLIVSISCRFFATRKSMYSNSILTEGIAYPLFILFVINNLRYIFHNHKKDLFASIIIALFLVLTRKQMYFVVAVLLISIIYNNKNSLKKICLTLVIVLVVIFGGSKIGNIAYMSITNGVATDTTSDSRFLTTIIYYCSSEESAQFIKDNNIRECFLQVYNACKEKEILKNYVSGSWFERVIEFGSNYDEIQINTMMPTTANYIKSNCKLDGVLLDKEVDRYNSVIAKELLVQEAPSIISTIIDNILAGFIITISAEKDFLVIPSIIMYLCYIAFLIYEIKNNKMNKEIVLSIYILISIILNVSLISLVIFCQTRYTIYNLGLFYVGGLILLKNSNLFTTVNKI